MPLTMVQMGSGLNSEVGKCRFVSSASVVFEVLNVKILNSQIIGTILKTFKIDFSLR